jgi:hypothetical protein
VLAACHTPAPPEEPLLSKEEFLKLIEEYDVGVTARDFDEVDIDDFVLKYEITQQLFDELNSGSSSLTFGRLLEWYVRDLPRWEREKALAPFLVRELQYVKSTEEEYLDFIDRYFEALGMDGRFYRQENNGILVYAVKQGEATRLFNFCQTSESRQLKLSRGEKDREDHYVIYIPTSQFLVGFYDDFYYSQNAKYLMYLSGFDFSYNEDDSEDDIFYERLHLIQTFTELDD